MSVLSNIPNFGYVEQGDALFLFQGNKGRVRLDYEKGNFEEKEWRKGDF